MKFIPRPSPLMGSEWSFLASSLPLMSVQPAASLEMTSQWELLSMLALS